MTEHAELPASGPADYLLAAMGTALLGGAAVGTTATVPFQLAVGTGSAFAACLLAVALVRFP